MEAWILLCTSYWWSSYRMIPTRCWNYSSGQFPGWHHCNISNRWRHTSPLIMKGPGIAVWSIRVDFIFFVCFLFIYCLLLLFLSGYYEINDPVVSPSEVICDRCDIYADCFMYVYQVLLCRFSVHSGDSWDQFVWHCSRFPWNFLAWKLF